MKKHSGRFQVLSLLVVAALLLPSSLMAQGSKTDFTGSWTYNASKSTTGQQQASGQGQRQGGFGGGDLVIKQEGNSISVERTMSTPDGSSRTVSSKYTLDGKESVNSTRMGDSKSTASWSADGKKLTIKTTRTMTRNGESRTVSTTEVWSLTDNKTLQIESTTPSPNGERKITSVYNKK